MIYEPNRKYRVTTRSCNTFISYIRYESTGVIHRFKNCYRVIMPFSGPKNYRSSNPKTQLHAYNLIATVIDEVLIEPLELTPTKDIAYALDRDGDWWKQVTVPYVPLPATWLSP